MSKERGVFRAIWKNFVASLTLGSRYKFIGKDFYGTKYYEEQSRSDSKRPSRYFVPVIKENFEQELPAEWEAWLRYRRKTPPSEEEIEFNYQLAIKKKQAAAKLQEEYSDEAKKLANKDLPAQPSASKPTFPGNFPTYTDYENFGRSYRPKDPYKEE